VNKAPLKAEAPLILSLVLLAALPYLITLDGFLIADDIKSVLRGTMPGHFPILKDPFWTSKHFFRPVTALLCRLDGLLWGGQVWGYRLSNITLLAATAVLTYLLLRKLYRPAISWFGAAVIAIHPTQVFTTAWITGRVDLVPGFLLVFSLLLLMAEKGKVKIAAGNLLFAAALFSKEVAITFPAIILLGGLLLNKESLKAAAARAGPATAMVAVYLAVRYAVDFWPHDSFYSPIGGSNVKGWVSNFVFLAQNVVYLALPAWNPMDFFREMIINSDSSPGFMALACAYLLSGALLPGYPLWKTARRRSVSPALLFGVLWFFIAVIPSVHVMRNLGGSRYLFPALPGAAIVVAEVAERFSARRSGGKIVALAILMVLAAGNIIEQTRWRAAMDLAEKTARRATQCAAAMEPGKNLAVFNLPEWSRGRPVYPWYDDYSLNLAHKFITGGSNKRILRGRALNRGICLRKDVRCIEWSRLINGNCP